MKKKLSISEIIKFLFETPQLFTIISEEELDNKQSIKFLSFFSNQDEIIDVIDNGDSLEFFI